MTDTVPTAPSHGAASWPVLDRNGHPYARSAFDLTTYAAPDGPRHVLTVLDTEPDEVDGDADTPEGFAEVVMPLDAVRALHAACAALLAAAGAL